MKQWYQLSHAVMSLYHLTCTMWRLVSESPWGHRPGSVSLPRGQLNLPDAVRTLETFLAKHSTPSLHVTCLRSALHRYSDGLNKSAVCCETYGSWGNAEWGGSVTGRTAWLCWNCRDIKVWCAWELWLCIAYGVLFLFLSWVLFFYLFSVFLIFLHFP